VVVRGELHLACHPRGDHGHRSGVDKQRQLEKRCGVADRGKWGWGSVVKGEGLPAEAAFIGRGGGPGDLPCPTGDAGGREGIEAPSA
jgi:hypothetical protein